MGLPIWSDLDRAINDGTKIDEAIQAAISAHNEDGESHLGADQAIEIHRENPVIDHPAESVVNDKIMAAARAYVAIVDPSSEFDFDSVDSAWGYAESIGGGNILITPGSHYLGSKLHVDGTINLIGTDPDTCIVIADEANNFCFETGYWATDWAGSFEFRNLTLRTLSPGFFVPKTSFEAYSSKLLINNCILDGESGHALNVVDHLVIADVTLMLTTVPIISCETGASLQNVDLDTVLTSGTLLFIGIGVNAEIQYWTLNNVRTRRWDEWDASVRLKLIDDGLLLRSSIFNCEFRQLQTQQIDFDGNAVLGSTFIPGSGDEIDLAWYFCGIIGCFFGSTSSTDVNYIAGTYIGCSMGINSGTVQPRASVVTPNGWRNFETASSGQTVFDYDQVGVYQKTPNATTTYTCDVPPAGEQRTMILLTSGTTPYTITFGSGFKTTGTLNSGSTSARRFIIEFISDGTYLIESSRTTAIA